jgi:hypothetical protein
MTYTWIVNSQRSRCVDAAVTCNPCGAWHSGLVGPWHAVPHLVAGAAASWLLARTGFSCRRYCSRVETCTVRKRRGDGNGASERAASIRSVRASGMMSTLRRRQKDVRCHRPTTAFLPRCAAADHRPTGRPFSPPPRGNGRAGGRRPNPARPPNVSHRDVNGYKIDGYH